MGAISLGIPATLCQVYGMGTRSGEAIKNLAILVCVSSDKEEDISGVHTETHPWPPPTSCHRDDITPTLDKQNCLKTLLNATGGQNRPGRESWCTAHSLLKSTIVHNPGGQVVYRWLENTEFPSTAGGPISAPCFFFLRFPQT